MSHHPARRARTVTAVVSAAAFASIAGGLAVTHAGRVGHPSGHPVAPPPTSVPATDPGSTPDVGSDNNAAPDGGGWTATPAPSGSLGVPRPANHGQSGAS